MEAALEPGRGNIVFFTDLYFGSPFNQVVNLSRNHAIYHVTGMNVPTLVEALVARNGGKSASEVCDIALEAAKDSVKDVRKLMSVADGQEEDEEF